MSAAISTRSRPAASIDGVLGVLGGLEVVRTLNDLDIKTKHPIVVTNWTNEEGARFAPAMLASGVFAGVHTLDYAYARTDGEGKSFGDELKRIGWKGDEPVGQRKMHAYFELPHRAGTDPRSRGQATSASSPMARACGGCEFTLTGKEAHTGSTPMTMRVNAGLGMARIIELVHESRDGLASPTRSVRRPHGGLARTRATSSPGKVVFTVDIRSPDQANARRDGARIEAEAPKICAELGVGCSRSSRSAISTRSPSTRRCVKAGPRGGREARLFAQAISSPAPATTPAGSTKVAPATMVMCPCVDGLSHNEAEDISPEWAAAGCDVLFHAVVETAVIVE